jgi:hypothetical protein
VRRFGDRVRGARIGAEAARERAKEAAREADAAECQLWSEQMEDFGGPAQPSPPIAQCLRGGYAWLEVQYKRCQTRASIPLEYVRRPRDTPIWKLEPALKCRSCRTPRYSPPVHMIKLTQQREITPYASVHPDDDGGKVASPFNPIKKAAERALRPPGKNDCLMKIPCLPVVSD